MCLVHDITLHVEMIKLLLDEKSVYEAYNTVAMELNVSVMDRR